MIAAGLAVIGGFRAWERRRERLKEQPLVHFRLLSIPSMRSGLTAFLFQNLILMGVFFAIPLYLQVVQGFDAFQTGVRMLPVSVTLFVTALVGARLAGRYPARTIVRAGLGLLLAACLILLLSTIKPEIETVPFAIAMAVLGIGMGLIVSQLGNVVQSAVGDEDRSEAGGLQFTAQQLGASLGTALIGAIVISGLIAGVLGQGRERPARLRGRQTAGRDQARGQRQLRLDRPGPRRRGSCGPGRADHRRDRRELRRSAAHGAEDRPADRGPARLRGVLHDPQPAERGPGGRARLWSPVDRPRVQAARTPPGPARCLRGSAPA